MEEYRIYRRILCIDLKSFFASVECALMGVDPYTTPVVVADKSHGRGAIVLAVSPYLKSKGVPSRCRIFELPKDENIIFCKPQMAKYIEYSSKVINIYLKYVSMDDIHIYSIDEAFMDFTSYSKLYKESNLDLAKKILADIKKETKLTATCGIGPNMLIAKLAMDIESKKNKSNIAEWNYDDIEPKLWPIRPISKMWGIGRRMEKRLNDLGLFTIGDIASYDVEKLKKKFGIIGEELWYHTHGIDMSLISEKAKYVPKSKSYGTSQVLFKDYSLIEARQIIIEIADEVASTLRSHDVYASVVHLFIGYSKDVEPALSHQERVNPTNIGKTISNVCLNLFEGYAVDAPIRVVGVSVSGITNQQVSQLTLFDVLEETSDDKVIFETMDLIKDKHGKNAIFRASSLLDESTFKERSKKIGGHNA